MACSWTPAKLGQSSLRVVPLGLSCGYGADGALFDRAFERGVNLYYWGSGRKQDFGHALSQHAQRERDRLVTVIQTYSRRANGVASSLETALRKLKLEYTDILLLGWWNAPPHAPILDAAQKLVDRGLAKSIQVSCHHRPTFLTLAKDPRIAHWMVRYNAVHPGAEADIFAHLGDNRPGIITYTATSWKELLTPSKMPDGEPPVRARDCYRFVLSHPAVDACYVGPSNKAELEESFAALDEGPLSDAEMDRMRRVGAYIHKQKSARAVGMGFAERFVNLVSGFGFRTSERALARYKGG